MPPLLAPVVEAGSLSAQEQPTIDIDAELRLRPWTAEDAGPVLAAYSDAEIQRWHLFRVDSLLEAREWIEATRAAWRSEAAATWAVAESERNSVVGRVTVHFLDLGEGVGEITYWVLPDARGAGVAARAARAVSDWAHEQGLHRVELLHSTQNHASCRVATRAEFAAEGVRRSAQLHQDGWHDLHVHSRIATPEV